MKAFDHHQTITLIIVRHFIHQLLDQIHTAAAIPVYIFLIRAIFELFGIKTGTLISHGDPHLTGSALDIQIHRQLLLQTIAILHRIDECFFQAETYIKKRSLIDIGWLKKSQHVMAYFLNFREITRDLKLFFHDFSFQISFLVYLAS